ncbi:MAG TPA: hypothetical protein VJZ71_13115 [Phycisphaerae bacterium]|nr:hypothetical protein [Phycisphaerae bacterium]
MSTRLVGITFCTFVLVGVANVSASLLGSDSAADVAYNGGWTAGSNGGTGFGAWSFVTNAGGNKGSFVASSANNGDGDGNSSGDINTAGRAWGTFANSGGEIFAVRPFTGGGLAVGQTLSIDMDNGFIDSGGVVGVRLTSSLTTLTNATREFEFRFVGGNSFYDVISNPNQTSTLGFTDGGLNLVFQLTSATTYSLSVTRFHDTQAPQVWNTTGTLVSGNPILGLALRNQNAGSNSQRDGFFNSISLTPEPASLGLLAMGLLMLRRWR